MVGAKLDQTTQGKAFEYSCLMALRDTVEKIRPVDVVINSSLGVAETAWNNLSIESRELMSTAAYAGIVSLLKMEPKIVEDGGDTLELALQADSRGEDGDVRDVLIIRRAIKWEIGLSVKHNHSAVKHPRLSKKIDFGKKWLDLPSSDEYFASIEPIFTKLEEYRSEGKAWSEVENVNSTVYIPILEAFKTELLRLDYENKGVVPGRLLEYLLGRHDFYKLIADDKHRYTMLQCFNLHNTLNKPSENVEPAMKARGTTMPTTIYHFDYKQGIQTTSGTTLQLVLDSDWGISFRVHSAKTLVEPSLKFDIQLTGVPSSLFSNIVNW